MSGEAVVVAHPNVALSKYWGKREGGHNLPAVPSLSVTLAGPATRTRLRWRGDLTRDRVVLDGRELEDREAIRMSSLIDRVRRSAGLSAFAEVESHNDFPTASGLASSASGFAALALAAVRAADLDWDSSRVSDLARRGSVSAARSIFGGFVELDAGPAEGDPDQQLSARCVAPPEHMPLTILVAVTGRQRKAISSTEGMKATMDRSPYARVWLEHAPGLHLRLRKALLARDFVMVGALAEESALAMHACALAAGVVYWNGATLAVLSTVRALRAQGTQAYATVDAGPHVKVLVRPADAAQVRAALDGTSGVERVLTATVGCGAREEASES